MKSSSLYDKPIIGYINTMADLTLLNIMWLICSLPIITLGASTSALYTVIFKIVNHEPYSVWKDFIGAIKVNFLRRTLLWFIIIFSGAFLAFDYNICVLNPMPILNIASYLILACALVYFFIVLYIFPVQAQYCGTVFQTLQISAALAFKHFLTTILLAVIPVVPFIICYYFPQIIKPVAGVLIVIGVAFLTFLQSHLFIIIFQKQQQ